MADTLIVFRHSLAWVDQGEERWLGQVKWSLDVKRVGHCLHDDVFDRGVTVVPCAGDEVRECSGAVHVCARARVRNNTAHLRVRVHICVHRAQTHALCVCVCVCGGEAVLSWGHVAQCKILLSV